MKRLALVMAGGKGERFWPESRKRLPKQFLPLVGNVPMIQRTFDSISKLVGKDGVFFIADRTMTGTAKKILNKLSGRQFICEPKGRNTAPCIGLSMVQLKKYFGDAVVIVMASDHYIKDERRFLRTVKTAFEIAENSNSIVTLGIKPKYPETGYGYIETEKKTGEKNGIRHFKVKRFVEKPDYATALKYVKAKRFFWNSGMFVGKISTFLNSIRICLPDLHHGLVCIEKKQNDTDKIYNGLESVSIDYGVMEKYDDIVMVEGTYYWDDIGSWFSISKYLNKDRHGNRFSGDVACADSSNNIIISKKGIVGTVGVSDLIIVSVDDAVLVCPVSQSQSVKKLLTEIQKNKKFDKYT